MIHEIFGMTGWVRGVTDQLAAEGYIAAAPDLLSWFGTNGGGTESLGKDVQAAFRKLTADEQIKRLDAVRDYRWRFHQPTTRWPPSVPAGAAGRAFHTQRINRR